MEIYSIGFTQSTAERFFGRLSAAGIMHLLDVRLNNVSQLAGFAKRDDLAFFLGKLCGAAYTHEPLLAPSQEMLDTYKKQKGTWADYERDFLALMARRHIETELDRTIFEQPTALLCSEPIADHCHCRLVLEYLQEKWGDINIVHL